MPPSQDRYIVKKELRDGVSVRHRYKDHARGKLALRGLLFLVFWSIAGLGTAWAQQGSSEADSLRSYELAEIVVGADEVEAVPPMTMQKVSLASLVREDAVSVAEVAKLIPSAFVQTNSRGETLVYIRNAGERQLALFFDGALVNIPWDNRVDLSLIPVGIIGGMTVAKGVPSVLYGTNVIGGAVNMTSRLLGRTGRFAEATAMVGSHGLKQGLGTYLYAKGRFNYAGAVGYATREATALPEGAELPYSQEDPDRRTNTDRDLFTFFSRGSMRLGKDAQVGVSLLHVDGKKGVAPEGHVDPAVDRVRFWRYPDWRNTMLIFNGATPVGENARLRGAVWGSHFLQTIDQYTSDAYDQLSDREEDDDVTLGARLIYRQSLGRGALSLSMNALTSTHRQRDSAFDEDGRPEPGPRLTYRQNIYSFGGEYDIRFGERFDLIVGASLDGIATPRTGDKPPRDPSFDYGVTSGLVYKINDTFALKGSAGRKVRFPTMRELFGAALNRFLVNPDLRPESSFLGETGLVAQSETIAGEAVFFLNRTYDTIDQRRTEDGRRQRINLDGSRVYGVEITGKTTPLPRVSLEGFVTWMKTRAFLDDGPDRPLVEKPEWLSTITAVYNAPWGLSLMLQSVYTGRAYALAEDNTLARLPTSLTLNGRVAYRIFLPRRQIFTELFFRVDNVTDEVTMPQLGLPAPGREIRGGVSVSF